MELRALSQFLVVVVGRSLMIRVLLPISGLLLALVVASVFGVAIRDGDTARAALNAKTRLIAEIAGRGAADAIWSLDPQLAKSSLAALAADPDYVGSELTDDHGTVLAADGAGQRTSGALIVAKAPVTRTDQGQQNTIGTLELRMSTARADVAIARATSALALIATAALLVVCGLLFWILRSATRPIVTLTDAMTKLSSGSLDTVIPALDRADEIGRMAHAVEVFKRNAIEVERLGDEQASMKARSERDRIELLDRMATQFESTVSAVLVGVTKACARMSERAESMADKMAAAERGTDTVIQATNATSDNVQAVAVATQQLSSSISKIASRVNDSAAIAGDTSDAAEKTSDTITLLSAQAQKIGSIISLIHDIASQTDLLALNATIEAARAGETGKGFAVVASEVKSLARQTARATDEISDNIQAIQAATAQAVDDIRAIAEVANRSREIATGIAGTIDEQSVATRELSSSISNAASGTQVVAHNTSTVARTISDAGGAARDLLSASRELGDEFQVLESQVQTFVASVRGAR